jgi:hypothetical protein
VLDLAPADLEILAGGSSPDKRLGVPLTREVVRQRLASVLPV